MNVYTDISQIDCKNGTVITVGTFDGLHAGHRVLIDSMLNLARTNNLTDVLITFNPHPRNVVNKNEKTSVLSSFDEKILLLNNLGISNVFVINFDEEFMQTPYEEFIVGFLVKKLNLKYLILGHDHKFGKNREGDEEKLKSISEEHDFKVIPIRSIEVEGETVSSTKIRRHLSLGEIEQANKYLSQRYYISGKVIKGAQRGRLLGYPTANIKPDAGKLLPKNGVYAVSCLIENKVYFGMMNIGKRPTFDNLEEPIIEVNIFDFNQDIYNKTIWIEIFDFIRNEIRFNSVDELIYQLEKDKEKTESYINLLIN